MQLFGPSGVRQFPTDRAPLTIVQGATADITAGASLVMAAYTVPANRRAEVVVSIYGTVTVVLAAGQFANLEVNVLPSGGAVQPVARLHFAPATAVGTRDRCEPGAPYFLRAGDNIVVQAAIGAGAGTLRTAGGIEGVEYDA